MLWRVMVNVWFWRFFSFALHCVRFAWLCFNDFTISFNTAVSFLLFFCSVNRFVYYIFVVCFFSVVVQFWFVETLTTSQPLHTVRTNPVTSTKCLTENAIVTLRSVKCGCTSMASLLLVATSVGSLSWTVGQGQNIDIAIFAIYCIVLFAIHNRCMPSNMNIFLET